jgi:hypothetical protein
MNCPHCQWWMTEAPELAGQLVACRGCHQPFVALGCHCPACPAVEAAGLLASAVSPARGIVDQPSRALEVSNRLVSNVILQWCDNVQSSPLVTTRLAAWARSGQPSATRHCWASQQVAPGAESRELWVIGGAAAKAIGVLFFVLWFRVAAESVIVIFNIATILSEMREQPARVA